jgi:cysteine desulfurase
MKRILNFNSNNYSLLSEDVSSAFYHAIKTYQNHGNLEFGSDISIKAKIEESRNQLANFLNADSQMLFFDGLSPKSDAGTILPILLYSDIRNIITLRSETKEKIQFLEGLEQSGKVKLEFIEQDQSGIINTLQLSELINRDNHKKLISLSHADRIKGNLAPVKEIASICKNKPAYFHLNTNLTIGRYVIDFKSLMPDFMSFSCNLIHGPEGIGGILINPSIKMDKSIFGLIYNYLRSVEHKNLALILAMENSFGLAIDDLEFYRKKISELKQYFTQQIDKRLNIMPINSMNDKEGLINLIPISIKTMQFGQLLAEKSDLKGFAVDINQISLDNTMESDEFMLSIALNEEITTHEIDSFIDYLEILLNETKNHQPNI